MIDTRYLSWEEGEVCTFFSSYTGLPIPKSTKFDYLYLIMHKTHFVPEPKLTNVIKIILWEIYECQLLNPCSKEFHTLWLNATNVSLLPSYKKKCILLFTGLLTQIENFFPSSKNTTTNERGSTHLQTGCWLTLDGIFAEVGVPEISQFYQS